MADLTKVDEWNLIPAYPVYVQYVGVFDMQDLYEFVIDWFRKNKFKFKEGLNFRKNAGPFGYEEKHKWLFWRRMEDYYQYKVDIYVHVFDLTEIQVKLPDGTTKPYNKGRLWIQIMGRVEFDYEKKFEKNTFYAQLRSYYHKYTIQKKAEALWWDRLYYRYILRIHNKIQQRLKMESEEYEHRYFPSVH